MKKHLHEIFHKKAGIFIFFVLILTSLLLFTGNHIAQASPSGENSSPIVNSLAEENELCFSCHQLPDMFLPLPSGEDLYITVDPEAFEESVHGQMEFACTQCHTNIGGYPHPELSVDDRREVSEQLTQVCMTCHTEAADKYAEGRHAQEYIKGNTDSALCVDCHTSHEVKDIRGSKVEIAKTCQKCHAEIYEVFEGSVHGAALLEDGNFDVPTCSDCHENHDNTGPGDPGYILFSPNICKTCHIDEELMAKYDINTDVFDTYVSDFHGTTVVIFENVSPDQETNKPVCIDCHGVHNILPATDEHSTVMKENLLDTCRRCHPDATSDFSDSWMSHYRPDIQNNPLVYMVDIFYYVLIPGTVGGMAFFIATDIWRTIRNKKKNGKGEH